MTSVAFILGVVPLMISQGAGAEMRRTLGTAVFSGMLGVTLFGLVLTPVFFFTIDWLSHTRLFTTRWMRQLSGATINLISLRPMRLAVARQWSERRVPASAATHPHAYAELHEPASLANGHSAATSVIDPPQHESESMTQS